MAQEATEILQQVIDGLWYYSEYEYPVDFFDIDATSYPEVLQTMAEKEGVLPDDFRKVSPPAFFNKFYNYLHGSDGPMAENARKFLALAEVLQNRFDYFHILRIEKKSPEIPVYFIACKHNKFAGLKTCSVETG